MRFRDRADAGRRLAERLRFLRGAQVIVLGVPRGGVPVAFEVARALGAPLDVILGAGAGAGSSERAEVERRAIGLRRGRPPLPLAGRTVVVVDDGMATGATATAACRVASARGADRVVLAVPVATPEAIIDVGKEVEIVCLQTPDGSRRIGQWYDEFDPTTDDEVARLLERSAPHGERDAGMGLERTRPAIVALVCSAGGFEALTVVLGGLPGDFPGSVIVLQHQSPRSGNPLPELLRVGCRLPVSAAADGGELRPGSVLVIPPGRHALVTTGCRLALIPSDGPPPYRPSADLLLTSMALVAPRRSIAVVLSGEGNDGATGASALHRLGGTVIASDEETSDHFAMPSAAIARAEVVDYVLPLGAIATLLQSLVAGSCTPTEQP